MDDPVAILRMFERIIAVVIAGISIYLGYRLFFHLPFEHTNEGQIELPGVKVVLSRVGPGIFFAAFGSIILYFSLTTQITVDNKVYLNKPVEQGENGKQDIQQAQVSTFTGMGSKGPTGVVTEQQRTKALNTIQMLNCTERLLANEPGIGDQISLATRDAKRVLLLSVWDEDDWGSIEQMGVTGPRDTAQFQIKSIFSATYTGCPK